MNGADRAPYGRVSSRIWLQPWSDDAKLLAVYLLTCHHRTLEGLFRLPKGYMVEDLGWTAERLRVALDELIDDDFCSYDAAVSVVFIHKALAYQAPENPNQERHALAALARLPETALLDRLVDAAELYCTGKFGVGFAARLRTWRDSGGRTRETPRSRRYNAEVVATVRERDRNVCRYCGVEVNWTDRRGQHGGTYDHVDPLGDSSADNLVVACRSCNSRKASRTPEDAGMSVLEPGQKPSDPGPSTVLERTQDGPETVIETQSKPTATTTTTPTTTKELIGDCPSEIAPPQNPTNDVKRVVYEDAFETWWTALGRTGSKADAHALWREWLKRGASVDDLQVAVERYVAHCASTDRPLMDGRTFLATTDKHRHEVNRWQEWADGEAHGSSDVHGDRRLMDVMTTAAEAFGLNGGNDNGNGGRKALGGRPARAAEGRSDAGGGMAARELGAGE